MELDINKLLEQIEAEGGLEKTASAPAEISDSDPMLKVAQDLFAGGRMMAKGFIAELRKEAAEGVKAPASTADAGVDGSVFRRVATSIQTRHGAGPAKPTVGAAGTGGTTTKKIEGDNPGVVYEATAPKMQESPKHEQHGNK